MGATRPASAFSAVSSRRIKKRLTDRSVIGTVCEPLFSVWTLHFPDARRVAPIRGSVWCLSVFECSRFTGQQYLIIESSSKLDFMRSVCTIFAQRQVDNQNKTYDNNTYNTELCGTERGAFP